ncbi:MAG: hypothetical protein QM214_01810 [Bacillota bacterium]|nr:hypothetical protein [Bacillota bacterium]HHU43215.1 DUF898 domain-containing protein [Clostridiales bacterium]
MFRNIKSEFTGSMGKYIGVSLGCFLLSLTVIGLPFAICIREKWMIENSRVVGMPLMFKGTGLQLLGKMLVWLFFVIITFSLYTIVIPYKYRQWVVENTVFAPYDD